MVNRFGYDVVQMILSLFVLFISRDWGYCLDDEPGEHLYNFPVLPAGTMYDADHQCRLQYGTDETEICTDKEVWITLYEPCHEKTCLRGLRPG